jgi:transcriptional regulator GlxA family with amidase domain
MRITEIADEFGFTDKSHLNRIFKKYRGGNQQTTKKSAAIAVISRGAIILNKIYFQF